MPAKSSVASVAAMQGTNAFARELASKQRRALLAAIEMPMAPGSLVQRDDDAQQRTEEERRGHAGRGSERDQRRATARVRNQTARNVEPRLKHGGKCARRHVKATAFEGCACVESSARPSTARRIWAA